MHAHQENNDWRKCTHTKKTLTADFTGGLVHYTLQYTVHYTVQYTVQYTVEQNGEFSLVKGKTEGRVQIRV
jgi:hypothetical protein